MPVEVVAVIVGISVVVGLASFVVLCWSNRRSLQRWWRKSSSRSYFTLGNQNPLRMWRITAIVNAQINRRNFRHRREYTISINGVPYSHWIPEESEAIVISLTDRNNQRFDVTVTTWSAGGSEVELELSVPNVNQSRLADWLADNAAALPPTPPPLPQAPPITTHLPEPLTLPISAPSADNQPARPTRDQRASLLTNRARASSPSSSVRTLFDTVPPR